MPRPLIYYPYQEEVLEVAHLGLRIRRNVVIACCVSAGKTIIAHGLASLLVGSVYTHMIVLVPSTSIQKQFLVVPRGINRKDGSRLRFCKRLPDLVTRAGVTRISDVRTGKSNLEVYLESANQQKAVLVLTYNVFRKHWDNLSDTLKARAKSLLLCTDEAHHVHEGEDGNLTSAVISRCAQAGAVLLKLTGTPFRTDGRLVYDEDRGGKGLGDILITRSLTDHMLQGYSPNPLESEVITVAGGCSKEDASGLHRTVGTPVDEPRGFRMMAEYLQNDGWPFVLIRIKQGTQRTNIRRVRLLKKILIEEFGLQPKDVIAAIDVEDPRHKAEFSKDLEAFNALVEYENRGECHVRDIPRVVICIRRADEGVNLPSRSHVIFWGAPMSMVTVVQFVGRCMRLRVHFGTLRAKILGYDARWLHRSKVAFFLGEADEAEEQHSKFLLRLCCYLSSFRDVALLSALSQLNDGIPYGERSLTEVKKVLDPEVTAYVRELLEEAKSLYSQFQTPYDQVSLEDYASMVGHLDTKRRALGLTGDGDPEQPVGFNDIRRALTAIYAEEHEGARQRLEEAVRQNIVDGCDLPEAIQRALDTVFPMFCAETRDRALHTLHTMPAWAILGAANRVREELDPGAQPQSFQEMVAAVDAIVAATGYLPRLEDPDPTKPQWTIRDYHLKALRGVRGIMAPRPGGLVDFLVERAAGNLSWVDRLRPVMAKLQVGQHAASASAAMSGRNMEEYARTGFRDMPEMVYYPNAWKALLRYDFADQLSLQQAHRLGSKNPRTVQSFVRRNGVKELARALDEGTLSPNQDV